MNTIEIKLHAGLPGGTYRNTYKHNHRNVDVFRVLDKPHGYMYFNYKTRTTGSFSISKVIDRIGQELDFGVVLPIEDVVNFFVYYAYNFDYPLMICIATMKNKGFVRYRYFTPPYKTSLKWTEMTELDRDPKWSTHMGVIKHKLNQTFHILGGVEIHIDKIYNQREHNIVTQEYPLPLNNYKIYSHQLESEREFMLNRLKCNNEVITEIEITRPVICVHVVTRNDINNNKPILICIAEEAKGKLDSNTFHWYSLQSLSSDKWEKRYTQNELVLSHDFERELDILCEKFHEFEIEINGSFFHSPGFTDFANNGELFRTVYETTTGSDYSMHTCELRSPVSFKVNNMNIYGTKQTGLPVNMFHKFHVFCHEKYDPYIPLIICAQVKENNYRWYRVEHFASNNWIEHSELENVNPETLTYSTELDKIYQKLFWINLEINYEKVKKELEQYSKNDRYIGKRESQHKNFKKVEVINFSSYPFSVKGVYLDGKQQKGIPEMKDVDSVYIFYYDGEKIIPMFICFEMSYSNEDFRWYSRLKEDTDTWLTNPDLKHSNPKDFTFQVLKHVQEGIYSYQLQEQGDKQEQISPMQTPTAKAIGGSIGAAACCGVGYMVYNNIGTILSFFR